MSALPPAGVHGGDAARIAAALGLAPESMIDLSASMNPFAPDVAAVLADRLRDGLAVTSYPDATVAAGLVAAAVGVDPDRLVLTNGGAEAIALVAQAVPVAAVVEPEFSLYRRHLQRVDPAAPRWRSNPSNPLGTLAAQHEVAAVWDEAFYPLATGSWTRGDAGAWRLGSLTKLWTCPGLRLGFAIAPDVAAARRIRERQPQWAVNGLALAVVADLLERTELIAWNRAISALRTTLAAELLALGFEVRDTSANWLLVGGDLRPRLAPLGVVVRDCGSFGLPGWSRVALPRVADLDRVVAAFAAVRPR